MSDLKMQYELWDEFLSVWPLARLAELGVLEFGGQIWEVWNQIIFKGEMDLSQVELTLENTNGAEVEP